MIVVTTPTSNTSRQVLENILDGGEPVRGIARDPSRLPSQTRKRVEVVEGSHGELDVVTKAFHGADTVFWLVPADARAESAEAAYVDFARPGCKAFKNAGVKRVVGSSALGRGWPKNAGHVLATLAMDDMIASTGVSYQALTCASFMDNVLRQVKLIKNQGMFSSPTPGDLKAPTCATRDIAFAASKLLLDRSWSGVGSLPILGPEDLSFNEMAQIISEVLGTPVRFEEMPLDALKVKRTGRGALPDAAFGESGLKITPLTNTVPQDASVLPAPDRPETTRYSRPDLRGGRQSAMEPCRPYLRRRSALKAVVRIRQEASKIIAGARRLEEADPRSPDVE